MEPHSRRRPVVLAVDDEPAVRSAFRVALEDMCDVVEAANGLAALDVLTRRAVDLVLLDERMPGMSGLELLERLRALRPDVPAALVTAVDTARTAVAAMKLGAFDYLTKPFDLEQLQAVVHRALASHGGSASKIVLMGGDVGTRACVAVLFRVWWPVEVPPTVADLVSEAATTSGVVVVDVCSVGGVDLMRRIRARSPLTRLIVINAKERSAFVGPRSEGCQAALRRPLRSAELFDEVAGLLHSASGDRPFPRLSPPVSGVIDHVIGHFPDASVEHIARVLATSPDHLSRLFREATGMRLKAYLNKVRVEAAKYLLAETDEKVETVAERLGLYGAAHLSRVFLQHCGERPGSYRRSTHATGDGGPPG
jgi:CheY-like chemotaxis protein/AraC-like DNA-binding protein